LGILGRSRRGFFLVGIHAPLTHVMPEHKISDTLPLAQEKMISVHSFIVVHHTNPFTPRPNT